MIVNDNVPFILVRHDTDQFILNTAFFIFKGFCRRRFAGIAHLAMQGGNDPSRAGFVHPGTNAYRTRLGYLPYRVPLQLPVAGMFCKIRQPGGKIRPLQLFFLDFATVNLAAQIIHPAADIRRLHRSIGNCLFQGGVIGTFAIVHAFTSVFPLWLFSVRLRC